MVMLNTTMPRDEVDSEADCSPVDEYIRRYYLPAMYGLIFAVGLVGNVTSIIIYLVKLRPWKSASIIMVNLATADLFYVSCMPFLAQHYTTEDWTMGELMCKFVRFGFHLNLYGSILFLTCLSVLRFVAVVYPLQASRVQRKSTGLIACLAVWLLSLVAIAPMLSMITLETKNNTTKCLDFASSDPADTVRWYSWVLTLLGYLLPLVVVCYSYACIARELASGPHARRPSRVRARKLTVVILVVFVLCFMPYHLLRALRLYTRTMDRTQASCALMRGVNAAYTISRPLAGLNTFFNLALYTLAGDRFQQALFSLLQRRPCLKARTPTSVAVIKMPGR